MKRAVSGWLGALAGLAFSTMGLIDMSEGLRFREYGGNDDTPIVIAVGVAIGALVSVTVLWRFPLTIIGAIVGLAAGMWLRDNASMGSVQPPWVFFLLFGLPILGMVGGYLLHLPRTTWARHPLEGAALVGFGAATVIYVTFSSIWATATHDPRCDPMPQPDGSSFVRLCPDMGTPVWIGILVALFAVAIGRSTYNNLNKGGLDSEPETSTR